MGVTGVVLDLMSAAVSLVLLFGLLRERRLRALESARLFMYMLGVLSAVLLADAVALAVLDANAVLFSVLETAAMVGAFALPALFAHYFFSFTRPSRRLRAVVSAVSHAACGAGAAMALVNLFVPFLYNVYELKPLSAAGVWIVRGLCMLSVGAALVCLVRGRTLLRNGDLPLLSAGALLPFVSIGLFMLFPTVRTQPALAALALLINYVRVATPRRRLKEEIVELENTRMFSSVAHIRPHYVYNVLSTIYYLCDTDSSLAQKALGRFSDYLRGVLELLGGGALVPFKRELALVTSYTALEQLRFGGRIAVRYEIGATDFMLPPFTLQALVENAIRHGADADGSGTVEILISAREHPDAYVLSVKDNFGGVAAAEDEYGGEPELAQSDALLSRLGCGTLRVKSTPGAGTAAKVKIFKKF